MPTGIAIALPAGTVGLVHPRSGLAARHGISVVNAPGTIDSGYRGEILVNLVNLDPTEPFTVHVGDRIAQLVVQEYLHADFTEAGSLPESDRGDTGHGSTGGFGTTATSNLRGSDHTVSIFRRRKADAETTVDGDTAVTEPTDETGQDEPDEAETAPVPDAPVDRPPDRSTRPRSTDDDGRLDLGALRINGREGMELRLEIDQEQQHVIAATAVLGESALQLQAFAAPRNGGLWADIRSEIAVAIAGQGGTADVEQGDLGAELRTRMPSAGPDGRTVFAPARFLGIDGPRWFLRGVISGRGAIDDDAAAPLLEIFRNTVVVRGSDPMAPRELLPLRLPQEDATPDAAGAHRPAGHVDRRPQPLRARARDHRGALMGLKERSATWRAPNPARGRRDPRAHPDRPRGRDRVRRRARRPPAGPVAGSVRCITLPPRQSVPVLVAELFDGERSVNLVWVGRRRIAGIEPGVFLVAEGRVTKAKGHLTIFNPTYQIVPTK